MDKKEIAKLLKIEIRTLYNWEKNRKDLYNFIIENTSKNKENNSEYDELLKYFKQLTEKEKNYYLSDIKARILKKEID